MSAFILWLTLDYTVNQGGIAPLVEHGHTLVDIKGRFLRKCEDLVTIDKIRPSTQ